MRLAIDPGGTTGIALRLDDGSLQTATIPSNNKDISPILLGLVNKPYQVIIIENFAAVHISTYGLFTVRIIGAVTAMAWLHKTPLEIYMPKDRYGFIPKAKALLKGTPHVIHQVDALSHLLRWEALNK